MTSPNVSSPASTIQASGWWQRAQRGDPDASAGTRLRAPHPEQATTDGCRSAQLRPAGSSSSSRRAALA